MLPGKQYSPHEALRVLWRYKFLILVPFLVASAGAVIVSKRLPNIYRSATLIMVVPQRIPDSYVKSTVQDRIEDRLPAIREQILSSSRLERIITDFNLYRDERQTQGMEAIVNRMRGDIESRIETRGQTFRISYVSRDAKTAQLVTERLASLFIEENSRDRETLAEGTSDFIDSQLQDAKKRLLEHEQKLQQYRERYAGELPSQVGTNLQLIQNAEGQIQGLAADSDRARERRLLLERELVDLQAQPVVAAPAVPRSVTPEALAGESTARQLEVAQSQLQQLLTRVKPDHPDVRILQRNIRDLQAKLQTEAGRQTGPTEVAKPINPGELAREKRKQDLEAQIADIDRQLADKQKKEDAARQVIAEHQAKLGAAPRRESELIELMRDYNTLQGSYATLLAKKEDSKMAAALERRNVGEQFKVLDPARFPQQPFSPDRQLIDLSAAGGGLLLGLFLAGFLEFRDSTFKNEEDVVRALSFQVLALVPVMTSSAERSSRKRRTIAIAAAVAVVLIMVTAAVAWRMQS